MFRRRGDIPESWPDGEEARLEVDALVTHRLTTASAAEITKKLTERQARALTVYALRARNSAVRSNDSAPASLAVRAVCLATASAFDVRDLIRAFAVVFDALVRTTTSRDEFVAAYVAGIGGDDTLRVPDFVTDFPTRTAPERSLASFGVATEGSGSTFTYRPY